MSIIDKAEQDANAHMKSHREFVDLVEEVFGVVDYSLAEGAVLYCLLTALTEGELTIADCRGYLRRVRDNIVSENTKN